MKMNMDVFAGLDEAVTSEYYAEVDGSEASVRSVVRVFFPKRKMSFSYYNDRFDLHCGDLVYVEGHFEGLLGRVLEVKRSFKIRLSDYKRVIGVVDTKVRGELYMAGAHFVSFEENVIDYGKVLSWVKAPHTDEEYVYGRDDVSFPLSDLKKMRVDSHIAERGYDYFKDNRVIYLSLNGETGRAIIEGNEIYELEFEYRDGNIFNLYCTCPCDYRCKHEYAAMLQLRSLLELIGTHYSEIYEAKGRFAAVSKRILLLYAIEEDAIGSIVFE